MTKKAFISRGMICFALAKGLISQVESCDQDALGAYCWGTLVWTVAGVPHGMTKVTIFTAELPWLSQCYLGSGIAFGSQ